MQIIFNLADGEIITTKAEEGSNVMRAAVDNDVEGIYGDCGGQAACATCHVYVHPDWIDKVGRAEEGSVEESMLEGAPADVEENSRLACQIECNASLDGLVVIVPEGQ